MPHELQGSFELSPWDANKIFSAGVDLPGYGNDY